MKRLRLAVDGAIAALDEASRRLESGESPEEAMPLLEARRRQLAQADSEIEAASQAGEKTDTRRRNHADYRRQADTTRKALELGRPSREAVSRARRTLATAFAEPPGQWVRAIGAESGLYYMRARYYDPITGTFPQRRPARPDRRAVDRAGRARRRNADATRIVGAGWGSRVAGAATSESLQLCGK